MAIQIVCGQCGEILNAPDRYAGRVARCKACGTRLQIPGSLGESDKDGDHTGKTLAAPPGLILLLVSLLATAVIWGTGISLLYYKSWNQSAISADHDFNHQVNDIKRLAETERLKAEIKDLGESKRELERLKARIRHLEEGKAESERIKQEASKIMAEAGRMRLREEENMHKILKI